MFIKSSPYFSGLFSFSASEFDKDGNGLITAEELRQALNNIIQNAIDSVEAKHKGKDTGALTLEVLSKRRDDILVAVIDNGLGLPDHSSERSREGHFSFRFLVGSFWAQALVKCSGFESRSDIWGHGARRQ